MPRALHTVNSGLQKTWTTVEVVYSLKNRNMIKNTIECSDTKTVGKRKEFICSQCMAGGCVC